MRVGIVTPFWSSKGAGLSTAVKGLSRALTREACEVQIFSVERCAAFEPDEWFGAPVTQCPSYGPRSFGYSPNLIKELLASDLAVVHLHGLWNHSSIVVRHWANRTGRPYVVSPHGMLAPAALRYSSGKKRVASLLFQKRCLECAQLLYATSERELEDIRSFGLTCDVEIVPIGCELGSIQTVPAAPREPSRSVLFLGRLHPVKGIPLLLRAWAKIEQNHRDFCLDIVGPSEASYKLELINLARRLGLERVRFHGPVYGDEKLARLKAASVFALPSETENFAITVIESLAAGTPVLASQNTPWSGLKQYGCGDWVEASSDAFASALGRIMSLTDEERRRMGKAGQVWVERSFAWSVIGSKMVQSYQRVTRAQRESSRKPV
jgi:glycosyltransferase involved in cell wall biosynthesis